MKTFGVVVHQHRDEALALGRRVADWLRGAGHLVRLLPEDAPALGLDELAVGPDEFVAGLDLAISVGGDGTILRTVHLVAPADVPVLGINAGHLGYLTAVEPPDMEEAVRRFLAGEHSIEERMQLDVTVDAPSGDVAPGAHVALNEASVERTPSGQTTRLRVDIDGTYFTTYTADGLIVATPTGSTAYSLSARGPIVAPGHRALLLTAVAPHMLFDRTLVLEPRTIMRLTVDNYRPASLVIDGEPQGVLSEGDSVVCTASARPARFVRFEARDFHQILKTKFGLNDR
ncbi:MAG: NAD(+)/NADH kinase [Actinomycetota bacterium]|nr:NAD(+)/NADH kinase [Actinomycetota bacterium]